MTHFKDLRSFLDALEAVGELQRIAHPVDLDLEIGAASRRAGETGQAAPLFETIRQRPDILTQSVDHKAGGSSRAMVLVSSARSAVTNPIVWLPIAGVTISLLRVPIAHPLMVSFETVARSAGGTSLFALGLMLYGEPVRINSNILTNIGLKNFLQPALMLVGVVLLALPHDIAQQAILTGAAPSATAASMFALKSKTYTADATSTVLLSTVLAIFISAALVVIMH